jgi:hypothetical protein
LLNQDKKMRAVTLRGFELFPQWRDGERERWEEMSRHGKTRFLVRNGVIFWGGWCILIALAPLTLLDFHGNAVPLKIALVGLVLWSASGMFSALLKWESTARSYARCFGAQRE